MTNLGNLNKGDLCESVEELERELLSGRWDKKILSAIKVFAKDKGILNHNASKQEILDLFKSDKNSRNEVIEYLMTKIPYLKNRKLWQNYVDTEEIDTSTSLVNGEIQKLLESNDEQEKAETEIVSFLKQKDYVKINADNVSQIVDKFNELYPEHITQSALNDLLGAIDGKNGEQEIQQEILKTKAVKNLVLDYWLGKQSFVGNDTHGAIDIKVKGGISENKNFFYISKFFKMYKKVIEDIIQEGETYYKNDKKLNKLIIITPNQNGSVSVTFPGLIDFETGNLVGTSKKEFNNLDEAEKYKSKLKRDLMKSL